MEYLFQKVAYLKGLADGLGIDESTKEGKLLLTIVETLEEFAEVMEEIVEDQIDLEEYVNFIDEDLADVEDDIYGDEEDYEFEDDDFEFDDYTDCCDDEGCDCHKGFGIDEYFEDEDEEDEE
jgi:predicted transcriptional regulator YdeE